MNLSRYRLGVAQRVGRLVALLFHDWGTRRGELSAARPGRSLPLGKTRYPVQEAGWAQGPFRTGVKSRPHRDPIVQPVAQSLYRLRYPAHRHTHTYKYIGVCVYIYIYTVCVCVLWLVLLHGTWTILKKFPRFVFAQPWTGNLLIFPSHVYCPSNVFTAIAGYYLENWWLSTFLAWRILRNGMPIEITPWPTGRISVSLSLSLALSHKHTQARTHWPPLQMAATHNSSSVSLSSIDTKMRRSEESLFARKHIFLYAWRTDWIWTVNYVADDTAGTQWRRLHIRLPLHKINVR